MTASTRPQAMLHPRAPISMLLDLVPVRRGDAQRSGERERHDQAEDDLADSVHRRQKLA